MIFITSCAKVFYSPDAFALAKAQTNIAILPPVVSIAANKKISADAMKEQQKTESLNFQKEMYSWMLKRKMQGKINVEILDIESTNAKLRKIGYPDTIYTPVELCQKLGLDGVITSNFAMSKPMSEGGAVALGIIFGVWGATNEVNVSMDIYDANTQKLIWNYRHAYSGSVGSTPSNLVDALMRHASRKMPYMVR